LSASPASTADDSKGTDRYTVAAGETTTTTREEEDDVTEGEDSLEDKYLVLPDPCSFCESLWISTENQDGGRTSGRSSAAGSVVGP
jgi:hypothetical protein